MEDGQGLSGPEESAEQEPEEQSAPRSRLWRIGGIVFKLALLGGIIAYLVRSDSLKLQTFTSLMHNWTWPLYAFLFLIPQFFLCAIRYRLLLFALGLPCTIRKVFSWTMIGTFFDVAMPSNGGDLIKAYYVGRSAGPGRRTLVLLSVLIDRIVGMLALFVFAWLVCMLAGKRVDDQPQLLHMSRILLVVCTGSVTGFFVMVSPWLEGNTLRQRIMHVLPFHAKIEELYRAFAGLRQHLGVLFIMLILSIISQICGCACVLCLAQAIGFTSVASGLPVQPEFVASLIILPLALFLNTFGFAGGLGVGELAFKTLFETMLGVRGGADLALAFHCVFLLSRFFGLPFVLFYRHKDHTDATQHPPPSRAKPVTVPFEKVA